MKRYAQGTPVTVQSSRGEIVGILAKHGVDRMAWAASPEGDTLEFQMGGHHFRFFIARPTWDDVRGDYVNKRDAYQQQTAVDAEWRRRWRANVLLLKAKLEFIEGGDTTLEREFMPYIVLRSGETLMDFIEGGGVPLLSDGR